LPLSSLKNESIAPLSMVFSSFPSIDFILFTFCIYILYLFTFFTCYMQLTFVFLLKLNIIIPQKKRKLKQTHLFLKRREIKYSFLL
jgi:hypothetical protein